MKMAGQQKMRSCAGALLGMASWLVAIFAPAHAFAAEVPSGFVQEVLATNLNCATAIAAAPDDRIFVTEQTGKLLVWKHGHLLERPALTLHVTDYWERGLIGVTL